MPRRATTSPATSASESAEAAPDDPNHRDLHNHDPEDDNRNERRFQAIVDPDIDLHDPKAPPPGRADRSLLAVIAAGGVIGAEARYGIGVALPHGRAEFPVSTLLINVTGCLLLGVLMVLVVELHHPHRLVRPFLGVGVLGGYTTFSSFAVDVQNLVDEHRPAVALAYWLATLLAGWAAVWMGMAVTRRLAGPAEARP